MCPPPPLSSSAENMLKVNEPRSRRPSLPRWQRGLEMLTQREQPQKPQESPREGAGREAEVEPWNVLQRVSHLFTR